MAAMEIGRFVRENAIRTMVAGYDGARCYSACILIVMGGVQRGAWNLRHSPGQSSTKATSLELQPAARVEYQKLSAMVEAYLGRDGRRPILFQQMMRVSSGRIRLLTPEEAKAFAIFGEDASYQEWLRARRAQRLGFWRTSRSFGGMEQEVEEYQNWVDAAFSRFDACKEQNIDVRACLGEVHQRPRSPCASFRKVPRP